MNRQRNNSRPTATNQVFGMSQNRMPRNSIVYHHLSPLECPKTGLDIHLQTNPNDGNPNLSYLHAHVECKIRFFWMVKTCQNHHLMLDFSHFSSAAGLRRLWCSSRTSLKSRACLAVWPLGVAESHFMGVSRKTRHQLGGNEINFGTIRHPPS